MVSESVEEEKEFIAPTIENGEELCIQACFSFFVFHAKLSTTNNDRTALSDISY